MKSTALIAVMAALAAACSQATPEQQITNDAAAALGGRDRILAVKTLVIEGEGINGNLGQDKTPDATGQTIQISGYRRAIDLAARRARVTQTRTPNFTYFLGPAPQTQITGVDGDVAYNLGPDGAATRAPEAAVKDRRAEIYQHPLTIVRAALDPAAKLENARTAGGERVVDVTTADGIRVTLAIDAATKLPTRVVTMADNTNLGDVAVETSFADYQDVGGLKLAAHLTTKTDKWMTADLKLTRQTVDGDTGDLAAPAAAAAAAAAPPPPTVTVTEVAKGIWWLSGQVYHSVVVEFADHLTLIEAPLNDARTLAVIAKARELRPDKPLTMVINTHHHFDHSGGIRAAVSEGLTVVTDAKNAAFYQDMVARPHTIVPDALAKNPKPLKLETVEGEKVLKDAAMTVVLYPIEGGPHADTLLMAYFPRERLLVEADTFNPNPGGGVQPFAPNLIENIKKRNLRIDRIVPMHGLIVPFADLLKTQAAAAN